LQELFHPASVAAGKFSPSLTASRGASSFAKLNPRKQVAFAPQEGHYSLDKFGSSCKSYYCMHIPKLKGAERWKA
jgi:hypothetical protein